MFTQYKFSHSQISAATVQAAKSLAAAGFTGNAVAFAASVISDRLRRDPSAYLQYGPYWWAVKAALVQLGTDFGPVDDAIVRMEYGAAFSTYGAMLAGEKFREFYLSTFLAGTAVFNLGDEGTYLLFDADMDARRLGAVTLEASATEPG